MEVPNAVAPVVPVVDVLIDRSSTTISIITTDDSSGESIEQTLTLEQAWGMVADLNEAITKLLQPQPFELPVAKTVIHHAPQVRAAVLESLGVPVVPAKRSYAPGPPSGDKCVRIPGVRAQIAEMLNPTPKTKKVRRPRQQHKPRVQVQEVFRPASVESLAALSTERRKESK
jgi:hypothetical protein